MPESKTEGWDVASNTLSIFHPTVHPLQGAYYNALPGWAPILDWSSPSLRALSPSWTKRIAGENHNFSIWIMNGSWLRRWFVASEAFKFILNAFYFLRFFFRLPHQKNSNSQTLVNSFEKNFFCLQIQIIYSKAKK